MQKHLAREKTTTHHHRPVRPHLRHRPRMHPEAEPVLKNIFARIGRPAPRPFQPDPFQLHALEAIRTGDCIVTAPTGAGKTWIAEEAIRIITQGGGRCWYASPLKALSNSKWTEFGQLFGADRVGILTGDLKDNPDAPIIVGTTEILRNQLYDAMHRGEDLNCELVILDEAHYLGDRDRGVVWEEIMIYLPVRINLLLLSATIGNAGEIAAWLTGLRRKTCEVIAATKRPVPLYPLFLHPTGRLLPFLEKDRLYGRITAYMEAEGQQGKKRHEPFPRFGEIIEVLRTFQLLPAIFFLKSRAECDGALKTCHSVRPEGEYDDAFHYELDDLLARFPFLEGHRQLPVMERSRVAAHHGGQLPAWKYLVETMMKKGHLDAIFATSTVAAGVNYPARTIVLFNSDLFNGHEFSPLTGTEFHQMTGRAGRRGLDKIGFLLIVPGRFMDPVHVRNLLFRKAEEIESQLRNDFSMVLNLLLSQTPEGIREIFTNSLAAYQRSRRRKRPAEETGAALWNDFRRYLDFLRAEGFVDQEDRLTESGIWASRLRLDQPLLIGECIKQQAFPNDPALMAAVIAPFVYDGDQEILMKDRRRRFRKLTEACRRMAATVRPLLRRLEEAGFPTRHLYFWTSWVIYEWAGGGDWDEIISRFGIADGDMAMLVLRTADNLRQIMSLRDTHPEIAARAEAARAAILREPVTFE
ncbi:MAG: DEAD/DEAH box helicase [Syntrophobacterales bacterium]|nr:DEAD/DEAH box helicase [Syntrophobacterales bacterium]